MSGHAPFDTGKAALEAATSSRRAQHSGILGYLPLASLVPSFLFSSASESKLEALGGAAERSTGGQREADLPTASSFLRGEQHVSQLGATRAANSGLSAPPSPSHNGSQPRSFVPHRLDRAQEALMHSPAPSRLSGGGHSNRQPPPQQHPHQHHQHEHPQDAAAAVSVSPATSAGGAWGSRCPSVAGADVAGGVADPGGVNGHHGTHSHGAGSGPGNGPAVSPDPDRGGAAKTRGGATPRAVGLSQPGSGGGGSGTGDADSGAGGLSAGGGGGIGAVMNSVRRSLSSGLGTPSASEHGGGGGGGGAGGGRGAMPHQPPISNPSAKPPIRAGTTPGAVGAAGPGSAQPQPPVSLFGMPLPRVPGSAGGGGGGGSHPAPPPISIPGLNHRVRAASPKPRRVPSLSGSLTPSGSSNASAPKPPINTTAAATSAAAAASRPSPGALIRYVLAPALLLPVAWPWLLLRLWYVALCTAGVLAGAAIDAVGALVDLLRRHRAGAELLGGWAVAWLGWLLAAYWAGLAQLQMTAEDALAGLSRLAAPLAAALLRRYPALSAALQPLQAVVGAVTASAYGAFCFVHDEIVPVALDLAERLPLVHGLLHRAVTSG